MKDFNFNNSTIKYLCGFDAIESIRGNAMLLILQINFK